MIHIIQDNETYTVSFRYDPVVVAMVKEVPGRRWDPGRKLWVIPKDKLGFLFNQLKGTQYESSINLISQENININSNLETTTTIPDIDISDVNFRVKPGFTPFRHQLDFMKFAIDRQNRQNFHGFLLADEQGLGKTLEVSNLAAYNREKYGYKHCLIICCINSSKYNWKRDIEEHFKYTETPYIIGTRRRRNGTLRYDGTGPEKLDDLKNETMYGDPNGQPLPYFLIINIEAIRYSTNKEYAIMKQLIRLIQAGKINMIAVDEIHKNASPKSTQGSCLLKIKKATQCHAMWIPMTGTPITSRPTDLFTPLRLIDAHYEGSFWKWCQEYCIYGGFGDHDIVGYKNIDQLKYMLHGNMIRRLKSQELDLPPKMHYTDYIENTEYQHRLYEKIKHTLKKDRQGILRSLNPLASFTKLRQVNGSPELVDPTLAVDKDYLSKNARMSRVLEHVEDAVERGEKVVIFSNWVEPLRTLYRFISEHYKTCCFIGTMKAEAREKNKRVFQNNPEYKVLLATVGAGGASHTFTAATTLIFYDEPWNASDKQQCEDRVHRIGTTEPIRIITMVSQHTVDDVVHQLVYNKEGVAGYIVDNNVDIRSNPKLLDMILGGNDENYSE